MYRRVFGGMFKALIAALILSLTLSLGAVPAEASSIICNGISADKFVGTIKGTQVPLLVMALEANTDDQFSRYDYFCDSIMYRKDEKYLLISVVAFIDDDEYFSVDMWRFPSDEAETEMLKQHQALRNPPNCRSSVCRTTTPETIYKLNGHAVVVTSHFVR